MRNFLKHPGVHLFYPLQSFWAKNFFYYGELLVSEKFLSNVGFPLWFYSLRRVSGLFWAKSIITFFFKFIHWFQICLTRIVQKLGANQGTLLQKEEGKNEERKKKRRAKTCFELFFFLREKNGNCSVKFRRTQAMTARSAAETASPPKTSRVNVVFGGLRYNFTVRRS